MTEIGKRALDLGIPVGYHNHMNSLGEAPDEVDRVMDAADSRYIKLELDIAHYHQGGGDSAKAIRKYRDRLLFLHIKDVESPVPAAAAEQSRSYRFVELGRGKVDLPAVFKALEDVNFRGWAIVELDSVPDKARTPKEAAMISKRYLEEELGMRI
jgi:inosose dehydratase